jgi:hypothetical protein
MNRLIAGVASAILATCLLGCGADRDDSLVAQQAAANGRSRFEANSVAGDVREWHVGLTADSAKAGEVTFTITNFGTTQHEFLVVATDFTLGEIPIRTDDRFDEEEPGLTVVDEISEWDPGVTKSLVLNLEPGHYQVVCNIPSHYAHGMFAAFEVV